MDTSSSSYRRRALAPTMVRGSATEVLARMSPILSFAIMTRDDRVTDSTVARERDAVMQASMASPQWGESTRRER
jgi:hypothetical protein